MPILENTALPDPVIRLLPKCRSSHRAAWATSAQRASAGGWRSFRPQPDTMPVKAVLSREPASIDERLSRRSSGLPKMSAVAMEAAGLSTA